MKSKKQIREAIDAMNRDRPDGENRMDRELRLEFDAAIKSLEWVIGEETTEHTLLDPYLGESNGEETDKD